MARWIVVIDLRKCIGCQCCVAVCSHGNQLPGEMMWRRVPEAKVDSIDDSRRIFAPVSCMHCANPPCMDVCPTGATFQRKDGIVDIDSDRCMGCAYCVLACPYFARTIAPEGHATLVSSSNGTPNGATNHLEEGVCTKCNLCWPKVEEGISRGFTPGVDPEASPMCAVSCLPQAIHFGDAENPDSKVSRLLRESQSFRLGEELGTDPSLYYLIE